MPYKKQMEACFKGRKHQIEIKVKRGNERKRKDRSERRRGKMRMADVSSLTVISKLKTIILIEMMILLQTNCIWKKQ